MAFPPFPNEICTFNYLQKLLTSDENYMKSENHSFDVCFSVSYIKRNSQELQSNEMVGWHHRLNGHEFGQTPGYGEGQGSLVYCSPWGIKESDKTE